MNMLTKGLVRLIKTKGFNLPNYMNVIYDIFSFVI